MSQLLHLGEVVSRNAYLFPNKTGARDLARSMTFRQWNERSCRLANALLGLGLARGDRVAILAYNRVEWLEIYVALAKAGLVAVPINFRLVGPEIRYIADDAKAQAFIVQDDLVDRVDEIRSDLAIAADTYLHFGGKMTPPGYRSYEALIERASASEPTVPVLLEDPWAFMYTSGTTGNPKGAIRSHESLALLALITALDQGFMRNETGLLVMPLGHANSLYYATVLAYCGASTVVYDRKHFDPEHLLKTLSDEQITFTSLVPTHYIMIQALPDAVRAKYRANSVTKLLISSAPARRETKLGIMEQFRKSQLLEAYGSTEAGWVTLLRHEEQLSRPGSIGRELTGCGRIKLLDDSGAEVAAGEVGELYSRTPYAFCGYWNLPEKTAAAFRGPYCSVGDMARRDEAGYYYLADRKSNMIISGGENVYPSEVESLIGSHPEVKDIAIIGISDDIWGEAVRAVVVRHDGHRVTEDELLSWCRTRIAGYKRPKSVVFIRDEEMPRTATGKILHRVLREAASGDTRGCAYDGQPWQHRCIGPDFSHWPVVFCGAARTSGNPRGSRRCGVRPREGLQRGEDGAIELGFRAEGRGNQQWRGRHLGGYPLPDRIEQIFPGLGGAATDDDRLRIEQGGDGDDGHRQVVSHLIGHDRQRRIPLRLSDDLGRAQVRAGRLLRPAPQRLAADQLRQVALAAAVLPQELAPDHQVAELAGGVMGAPIELPIEDDSDPDPGAEGQEGKAGQVPRGPAPALAEGRHIGVMVDDHRNVQLGSEEIAEGHPRPTGEIAGGEDDPGRGIDQPGDRDPDRPEVGAMLSAAGKEGIDRLDQTIDHRLGTDLGGSLKGVLGEDRLRCGRPGQESGLGPADVDADDDVVGGVLPIADCQSLSPTVSFAHENDRCFDTCRSSFVSTAQARRPPSRVSTSRSPPASTSSSSRRTCGYERRLTDDTAPAGSGSGAATGFSWTPSACHASRRARTGMKTLPRRPTGRAPRPRSRGPGRLSPSKRRPRSRRPACDGPER